MNSTKRILCSVLVSSLAVGGVAHADLGLWQDEVVAGTSAVFSDTNIFEPTTRDIGPLSGNKTYEFIVNASPLGNSSALIGVRGAAPNQAIKFEQWFNTMRYGVTQFGMIDLLFPGILTDFNVDVHLAFIVDSASNLTTLYVNGVMISSLNFTVNLSGWVGVGQTAFPAISDPLDGTIIGIATYDSVLPDEEIQNHADAYFALPIDIDIKPGSCPNPFNRSSNGVLPVAVPGTVDFDAAQIDLSTVQLARADGVGGSANPLEGPPGPHSVLEDVATLFDGEGCECHDLGGDGIDDLSMKFRTRDLVDALELNDLSGGVVVELVLSGSLLDGTPFVAGDCIVIVPPGDLAPANAFVGSNVSDTFVPVTPIDLNFDGDGFADFARSYYSGTLLTLTAPLRSDGRRFVRWSVDGVLQEVGVRTLDLVVDQDVNLRAIYERGRRPRPDRPVEDDGSVE